MQGRKLAQKDYKVRYNVARTLYWELYKKSYSCHEVKWYDREPENVTENDNCKSLWDFTIQSDHAVQPRRPDILVINKRGKTYQLINVAYPADRTVDIKEEKEIDKY